MKKDPKEKKKTLINVIIAAVSIIIVAAIFIIRFTPWVWYDHSAKPLGSRMEYIGKHDYGCAPGPCIGGEPGTTYYYATDMSIEEVESYFKEAKLKEQPQPESETTSIWLHNDKMDDGFVINYYKKAYIDKETQRQLGLKETDKDVLKLDARYYPIAKDSL
jgi:hypothetical protein